MSYLIPSQKNKKEEENFYDQKQAIVLMTT